LPLTPALSRWERERFVEVLEFAGSSGQG